jgi:hypothetical protein
MGRCLTQNCEGLFSVLLEKKKRALYYIGSAYTRLEAILPPGSARH